jgi:hypothetical protein
MYRTPKQASLSPDFFKKERDAYDDWQRAFWRELFQNSIDAGAKEINILIEDSPGMGIFGDDAEILDVTKVIFEDNGTGMDLETLNNVYFRLGESTKTGNENTTGGYGRGRLITCFANDRYTILTQNNFVEGKGNLYECDSIEEAIDRKKSEIQNSIQRSSWNTVEDYQKQLDELNSFRSGFKGCRLEVDFNPNDYSGFQAHKNATYNSLHNSLIQYLSQAQLPCRVNVNGSQWNNFLTKGKKVRELYIKDPNTEKEMLMGHVHVKKSGDSKKFGNRVIFRIDGAPMYERYISSDAQVVFEIDKANHREFLTSNRDGFKAAYQQPVNDFIDELVVDNVTALKEQKKSQNYYVTGEKGDISKKIDVSQLDYNNIDTQILEEAELISADITRVDDFSIINDEAFNKGIGQVTPDVLRHFLNEIKNGDDSFLRFYANENEIEHFKRLMQEYDIEGAAKRMPPKLSKYVVSILSEQVSREFKKQQTYDMHNLHIKAEDPPAPIKRIIRNFDPKNWDPETGKGKTTRALFEAWTVACESAIENLLKLEPQLGPIIFRTGWYFSDVEQDYFGDKFRELRTEAVHEKLDDDTHLILLNPVTPDGKIAFKTSKKEDLLKLINLAIHETAHVAAGKRHNQDFAYIMTDLNGKMMPKLNDIVKDMQLRMNEAKNNFYSKKDLSENTSHHPKF